MRIQREKSSRPGLKRLRSKGPVQSRNELQVSSFLDTLKAKQNAQLQGELEGLMALLEARGEALKEHPSPGNLREYREVICEVVALVTANEYQLRERSGRDRFGNARVYRTVHRINEQLSALKEAIVSGQAPQLALLARLEEIHGLVLDLYL